MKLIAIGLYIAAIIIANVLTANQIPIEFQFLGQTWIVTWGTFFIAATFFLRDAVQVLMGRTAAYMAIAVALAANIVLSVHYDNLLWITIGSALAFATSETLDTEIFTRLRERLAARVAFSGVAGGTVDSIIFALVGLSPLTTGLVPWEFLWTTVVAQVVVKSVANVLVAIPITRVQPEAA